MSKLICQSQSSLPPLKSGKSRIESMLTFVNLTERVVDVVWLNFEGQRVKFKTLRPRDEVVANTFVGHPWVFRDALTGDKMVVEFKEVYMPAAPDSPAPTRRIVHITIPVYTLRERCMQVVRKLCPRKDISTLDLPRHLITELLAPPS